MNSKYNITRTFFGKFEDEKFCRLLFDTKRVDDAANMSRGMLQQVWLKEGCSLPVDTCQIQVCFRIQGVGGGGGGRAVTNVIRTCGPTHLLVFDFMSNKICLNQNFNGILTLEKSNTETRACRTKLDIVMLYSNHSQIL